MEQRSARLAAPSIAAVRHSVLIVDDSAAQRQLLAAVLSKADLDVVQASSAEEALAICSGADGDRIRIIVSDWQMPGMDGPDFCKAFRQMRGDDFAYFILLTSRTDSMAKTRGLEAGADDFVTRPIDMAELRARLQTGRRILNMHEVLLHRNHEVQTTLSELERLQDATNRDLAEARTLQQSFLPQPHHKVDGSELSLRLLTFEQIGGDLVGYLPISSDETALFSIDVSGHGIASALMTGRLAEVFSGRDSERNFVFGTSLHEADSPETVMGRLNDLMLEEMSTDIYFTAVIAYVNTKTGDVRFSQAGHPHPLIRRANGQVERVGSGGPPVGLLPGAPFTLCEAKLAPGDMFLAYSDGLTECTDTWGDMLEEEGLMELVATISPDTENAVSTIERGLRDHTGIHGMEDDVSMILFRYDRPTSVAVAAE